MIIHSKIKDYHLNFEDDFSFVANLIKLENAYFVIDKNLYDIYFHQLFSDVPADKLTIIESLEGNKTIETALMLCEAMSELTAKRNIRLVSLGGGIIQDISGFVASVLYRGIHWTFVPTTLLAACDSCIGSKTSLNYKQYKNLLGTFYPPEEIHVCSRFFKTLTERDYLSGLGEVVKFNLMIGEKGLQRIEKDIRSLLNREEVVLNKYVESSLAFKIPFIEEDEFDQGVRIHLNFAHTFGHAFETVSDFRIPHGTAVAMGMMVANRISLSRGYLANDMVVRFEHILKQIICIDHKELIFDVDRIIAAMSKDKKQTGNYITAVLLQADMKLGIFKDLKNEEILDSLNAMITCLK